MITCQSELGFRAAGFGAAEGAGMGFATEGFARADFAKAPHARQREIAPTSEKVGNRVPIIQYKVQEKCHRVTSFGPFQVAFPYWTIAAFHRSVADA